MPIENVGLTDADGRSAYQVAVDGGFEGTEEEWLASLVGPIGPQGPTGQRCVLLLVRYFLHKLFRQKYTPNNRQKNCDNQ